MEEGLRLYQMFKYFKKIVMGPDVQLKFENQSYGRVSMLIGNSVIFESSEWAPGIWAGMEGHWVHSNNYDYGYRVLDVDFATRSIKLDWTKGLNVGDSLYGIGSQRLIDGRKGY